MPKLKPDAAQRRKEIVGAWQRYCNIPDERAAKLLGLSRAVYYDRKKLGNWKIEELHKAIRAFHIPPADALDLLTVGCYPMEQFMERERKRKHGNQ